MSTPTDAVSAPQKARVQQHWERETCGIRYADELADRERFFAEIREARYGLEPYIPVFADFSSGKGRTLLEIGVGAGADFVQWVRAGARARGVDLTEAGVALTREHVQLAGFANADWEVRQADAEALPFDADTFDLVYSWGVLHHTPDTRQAFAEALRVLKPGGELRAMIYRLPSWSGWMLKAQHGWLRGRFGLTAREAIFEHLESPGTKAYTEPEARALLEAVGFGDITLSAQLGPADVLSIRPSEKYRSPLFRLIWALYPRWLVRALGNRFGLCLLIRARKPVLA
ncbi:MAG: methyltransferase domain-containing protein [Gemmatimonadota bacterium]